MTEGQPGRHEPEFPRDPEEARVDLELTRQELGETVEELERRLNVPARAKERAGKAAYAMHDRIPSGLLDRAGEVAAAVRRSPLLTAGSVLLGFVIAGWFLRNRRGQNRNS